MIGLIGLYYYSVHVIEVTIFIFSEIFYMAWGGAIIPPKSTTMTQKNIANTFPISFFIGINYA